LKSSFFAAFFFLALGIAGKRKGFEAKKNDSPTPWIFERF
jgi:hypothetical protein